MANDGFHDGGCLCGALRFRAEGEPARVNVCHCRFCQRLTGSAFLVEPMFLKPQVSFTSGEPALYQHLGQHGRSLWLQYCRHCSTKVALGFERFPDHYGICGGTFDDPHWFRPTRHIFTASAAPWVQYPAGVECFSAHAIKLDGTPEVPWQRSAEPSRETLQNHACGPWPLGGG
jgi:hypothetical protein